MADNFKKLMYMMLIISQVFIKQVINWRGPKGQSTTFGIYCSSPFNKDPPANMCTFKDAKQAFTYYDAYHICQAASKHINTQKSNNHNECADQSGNFDAWYIDNWNIYTENTNNMKMNSDNEAELVNEDVFSLKYFVVCDFRDANDTILKLSPDCTSNKIYWYLNIDQFHVYDTSSFFNIKNINIIINENIYKSNNTSGGFITLDSNEEQINSSLLLSQTDIVDIVDISPYMQSTFFIELNFTKYENSSNEAGSVLYESSSNYTNHSKSISTYNESTEMLKIHEIEFYVRENRVRGILIENVTLRHFIETITNINGTKINRFEQRKILRYYNITNSESELELIEQNETKNVSTKGARTDTQIHLNKNLTYFQCYSDDKNVTVGQINIKTYLNSSSIVRNQTQGAILFQITALRELNWTQIVIPYSINNDFGLNLTENGSYVIDEPVNDVYNGVKNRLSIIETKIVQDILIETNNKNDSFIITLLTSKNSTVITQDYRFFIIYMTFVAETFQTSQLIYRRNVIIQNSTSSKSAINDDYVDDNVKLKIVVENVTSIFANSANTTRITVDKYNITSFKWDNTTSMKILTSDSHTFDINRVLVTDDAFNKTIFEVKSELIQIIENKTCGRQCIPPKPNITIISNYTTVTNISSFVINQNIQTVDQNKFEFIEFNSTTIRTNNPDLIDTSAHTTDSISSGKTGKVISLSQVSPYPIVQHSDFVEYMEDAFGWEDDLYSQFINQTTNITCIFNPFADANPTTPYIPEDTTTIPITPFISTTPVIETGEWYTVQCILKKKRKNIKGEVQFKEYIIKNFELCDKLDQNSVNNKINRYTAELTDKVDKINQTTNNTVKEIEKKYIKQITASRALNWLAIGFVCGLATLVLLNDCVNIFLLSISKYKSYLITKNDIEWKDYGAEEYERRGELFREVREKNDSIAIQLKTIKVNKT